MEEDRVLVTGGTGYVATYCIVDLLRRGYKVRATVRSLTRADSVRELIRNEGIDKLQNIDFIEADLLNDNHWKEAAHGCRYILHIASPLPLEHIKDENEVVRPAVEGVERVLRAAREQGVERVVMTSNFGAVGYSRSDHTHPATEEDWTDSSQPGLSIYNKSKVLAEQRAWEFMEMEGGNLELTVVNPVGVFGPMADHKLSAGHSLLLSVLDGTLRAAPKIDLAIVDVRDLADLHIRAMTSPYARGERFIATTEGTMSLLEIAKLVSRQRPRLAPKAASKTLPTWLLKIIAVFIPKARPLLSLVGVDRRASNKKAKESLGWMPRPREETILATVDALKQRGLLTKKI